MYMNYISDLVFLSSVSIFVKIFGAESQYHRHKDVIGNVSELRPIF
jgi:hypothetical protein